MSYQDKNLTCSDCFHSFAFSARDQQLFGELGYDRPGRCRSCWKAREVRRRGEGGLATLISPPVFRSRSVPDADAHPIVVMDGARANSEKLEYRDGLS